MLMSRLHKPGDEIRYDDPATGDWYEARLRHRERRDGKTGWAVIVTNHGTFGIQILCSVRHLTEEQMTPLSGQRMPRSTFITVVLCGLIAVALIAIGGVSFLRDDSQGGVQGLAAALVVVVVTGLLARRWGHRRVS